MATEEQEKGFASLTSPVDPGRVKMDTSGEVYVQRATSGGPFTYLWSDLDPFTQGYIEALLSKPFAKPFPLMPVYLGFSDLAPEALARAIADCTVRCRVNKAWANPQLRYQGELFWRKRQDGALAATFPPVTATLGNDGKVYLRDAQS